MNGAEFSRKMVLACNCAFLCMLLSCGVAVPPVSFPPGVSPALSEHFGVTGTCSQLTKRLAALRTFFDLLEIVEKHF